MRSVTLFFFVNAHMTEMRTDLHQSKLLFTGVVVSGGSLILLRVVRTLLVGILVGRMNQLPRVLQHNKSQRFAVVLIH